VDPNPTLLRRGRRGSARRLVLLCVGVGMLLLAPSAGGVPGDPTPPVITVSITGTVGLNGWYRSNVTVNWTITDPESVILSTTGCNTTTLTADTLGTVLSCSAESDGGTTKIDKSVKVDKTAPAVSASAERAPNATGWYNAPVTVSFSGTDGTSQIASCTSTRYAGPDNAAVAVAGSCSDNAGNVTGASFPLKYDGTAPTFTLVSAKRGNRSFLIAWKASTDTARVEITRTPGRNGAPDTLVYQGAADTFRDTGLIVGRNYQYQVSGFDDALNRVDRTLIVTASGALLSPLPGVHVKMTKPPIFVWSPVKGASYYNFQLIRGRRVFSAWPARPSFRLPRTWIYRGRRHRLRPGVYRWYVWPGFGPIRARHYGRMLGSSTFVVTR
jgi:hypothetical protein